MLQVETSRGEFNRAPVIRKSPALNMPVDFTAYLLSSSPPGFEFYALRDRTMGVGKPIRPACSTVNSLIQRSQSDVCLTSRAITNESTTSNSNSDSELSDRISKLHLSKSTSRLRVGKKSVSFADEKGYRLTQVRVMTESSSTPPRIKPEVLARLTHGAQVEANTSAAPALVLGFQQPASDYLAFRERLERDSVSLENVILKDYNLMGTVKVKNISFEKSVLVRVTFDGWENHHDIAAQYVPDQQGTSGNPYDTFSFQIDVPPNFDVSKTVEFAVCYEANNQQFWDSNNGQNYQVRSAKWESPKEEPSKSQNIFSLDYNDNNWTMFSSWNELQNDVPYW